MRLFPSYCDIWNFTRLTLAAAAANTNTSTLHTSSGEFPECLRELPVASVPALRFGQAAARHNLAVVVRDSVGTRH